MKIYFTLCFECDCVGENNNKTLTSTTSSACVSYYILKHHLYIFQRTVLDKAYNLNRQTNKEKIINEIKLATKFLMKESIQNVMRIIYSNEVM